VVWTGCEGRVFLDQVSMSRWTTCVLPTNVYCLPSHAYTQTHTASTWSSLPAAAVRSLPGWPQGGSQVQHCLHGDDGRIPHLPTEVPRNSSLEGNEGKHNDRPWQ